MLAESLSPQRPLVTVCGSGGPWRELSPEDMKQVREMARRCRESGYTHCGGQGPAR